MVGTQDRIADSRGAAKSNPKGVAAIWWRQSTKDQSASQETQITEARAMLEAEGYEVKYVLGQEWHSLSILDAPKMQELLALVRHGRVKAIGMYHGDRLAGNPAQKAIILDTCEKAGIKLLAKHAPISEGPEGELVEYVRTWGKEQQVLRTQQAARDGLRDRALLEGLPTNGKPPYGYRYKYELMGDKKRPVALVTDPATYPVVCRIWQLALAGATVRRIGQALAAEGIPSPRGKKSWETSSINIILKNPTYAGRFYTLRYAATTPEKRRKQTFGKTTVKRKDAEDWHLIDFPIEAPPVTWEQFEEVQRRKEANKRLSSRNAGRVYLLSGFLFCPTHNRSMGLTSTRPKQGSFYYCCTLRHKKLLGFDGCDGDFINGERAEAAVWQAVSDLLKDPKEFMAAMERRRGIASGNEAEVQDYIKTLERKAAKVDEMETELVGLKLRGEVSEEAYNRQQALLKAERTHYRDEVTRQRATLQALRQKAGAVDALVAARERLVHDLDSATPEYRRWVLKVLDTRIIPKDGDLEISFGVSAGGAHGEAVDSVQITEGIYTENEYRFNLDVPLHEPVAVRMDKA